MAIDEAFVPVAARQGLAAALWENPVQRRRVSAVGKQPLPVAWVGRWRTGARNRKTILRAINGGALANWELRRLDTGLRV